jgi:hypothetical protein
MKGRTNRQALRAMSISILLFAPLAHNEAVTPLKPAAKEALTPTFYVSQNKTQLVKLSHGNFTAGLCGSEASAFAALFNNIGIYYSF